MKTELDLFELEIKLKLELVWKTHNNSWLFHNSVLDTNSQIRPAIAYYIF